MQCAGAPDAAMRRVATTIVAAMTVASVAAGIVMTVIATGAVADEMVAAAMAAMWAGARSMSSLQLPL